MNLRVWGICSVEARGRPTFLPFCLSCGKPRYLEQPQLLVVSLYLLHMVRSRDLVKKGGGTANTYIVLEVKHILLDRVCKRSFGLVIIAWGEDLSHCLTTIISNELSSLDLIPTQPLHADFQPIFAAREPIRGTWKSVCCLIMQKNHTLIAILSNGLSSRLSINQTSTQDLAPLT